MNRIYIIIIVFFLLPTLASSQSLTLPELEQLEVKLTLEDSAQKLPILMQLADGYQGKNTERSLLYILEAIPRAQSDSVGLGEAYFVLGRILHYDLADYDSALVTYFEAADRLENTHRQGYFRVRLAIAEMYQETGNYREALEELVNVEMALAAYAYPELVATTQLQMARLYTQLQEGANAQLKLETALVYFEENGDWQGVGDVYLALGQLRAQQNLWSAADSAYYSAERAYQEAQSARGLGWVAMGKGHVYRFQNQPEQANEAYQQAIGHFKVIAYREGEAQAHWHRGTLAITMTHYSLAEECFLRSVELALASNDPQQLLLAYQSLYNLYVSQNDIDAAAEYKDQFLAISEFVFKEENERKVAELEAKYEVERMETNLANLQRDREMQDAALAQQSRIQNLLFMLTTLLLTLAVAGVYFYLRIRRSNAALKQSHGQVQQQYEAVEALNETKDRFFSIIAHDIKGPINSLRSFANLLINYTDSLSTEEIQKLAGDLDDSLKNLFSLLENLLTWARSQSGKLDFNPTQWPLRAVIEETIDILKPTAEKKSIALTYTVPEAHEVVADRNMITTVIRNLIANALKFTHENGTVSVVVETYIDAYEIAIRDTGIGIPDSIKKKLFKVGEKVTQKGTANEAGTGLGLILCKEFVEKNKGSIWVESKDKEGSTFRFTLPKSTLTP